MDITAVDRSATLGRSPLHRASPIAKVIAFACVLASVVVNSNVLVILGVGIAVASAVVAWRLPGRSIASLAARSRFHAAGRSRPSSLFAILSSGGAAAIVRSNIASGASA